MQILLLLLRRPGEVVTREELRQALWAADASVDFDVGLSTALRKLREALRDSAESPRFVETLPRRGYRFIAPVSIDQPPSPPKRFDRRWINAAAAAVIIIAAAAIVLLHRPALRSVAVVPFENLTDDASQRALANGVTNRLAASLGLRVIPRASTEVDMVVTGSVNKAGIFAQLIRTSDGQVIFARRYQGESRIAADLADAIRKAGGPPSPARRPRS